MYMFVPVTSSSRTKYKASTTTTETAHAVLDRDLGSSVKISREAIFNLLLSATGRSKGTLFGQFLFQKPGCNGMNFASLEFFCAAHVFARIERIMNLENLENFRLLQKKKKKLRPGTNAQIISKFDVSPFLLHEPTVLVFVMLTRRFTYKVGGTQP